MKIGTIEQMIDDMKSGVYNFTDNGKCSNCGACCTNILPMTDKEVERIRQYVKKHNIKDKAFSVFADNTVNMICPFRDENEKKCVIYEIRPTICREFKCDSTNKYSPEFIKFYKDNEPRVVFVREEFFR